MNNSSRKFYFLLLKNEKQKLFVDLSVLIEGTLFVIRDNIKVYFIHIVYTEEMDNTIIVYSVNKTAHFRWNNCRKKFITGRVFGQMEHNCFMFHVHLENTL